MWPFRRRKPPNPCIQIEIFSDGNAVAQAMYECPTDANRATELGKALATLSIHLSSGALMPALRDAIILGGRMGDGHLNYAAKVAVSLIDGEMMGFAEDEPVVHASQVFGGEGHH